MDQPLKAGFDIEEVYNDHLPKATNTHYSG